MAKIRTNTKRSSKQQHTTQRCGTFNLCQSIIQTHKHTWHHW